jgi:hypothetical protein
MQELIKLCGRGGDELASFVVGGSGAAWSRDYNAILIPTLRLEPVVIRAIAAGSSLFSQLSGVDLLRDGHIDRDVWSYCWGDLVVFETGESAAKRVVFLRGEIAMPDLTTVYRYLKEVPKCVASAV